jgi:hypothetical protein
MAATMKTAMGLNVLVGYIDDVFARMHKAPFRAGPSSILGMNQAVFVYHLSTSASGRREVR